MKLLSRIAVGIALLAAGGIAIWFFWVSPAPPVPATAAGPQWFRDVTDECGLDFVHDAGPLGNYFMPQVMGSGAALLDFDGDGLLDLYLLQNAGPNSSATNRLYRHLPGGRFRDVSKGSGLDIAGYNMGVAVGDVNNDGWPDVLVTQYGGVKLFLNNGDGTFRDATEQSRLSNPTWGASAAFFDYDRDGWLDLVVVNYVDYDPSRRCKLIRGVPDYCPPSHFPGMITRLFRNAGQDGSGKWLGFRDVTVKSGLAKEQGAGLGVVCADFDGDGWPDIYVANDGQPNRLWMNQKNGTFKDEAPIRGAAYNRMGEPQAGMGVALGDVDGDGLLDLFVTNFSTQTHSLWKQGPRGLFREVAGSTGVARLGWQGTGFGTVLVDFDQDGALDLAVVNGYVLKANTLVAPELGPHWGWYADRNQLLANDGKGRFTDISLRNPAFCGTPNVARGLACGDVFGDGAPALLVTTTAGRARLFRNVAPDRGHWLLVRALVASPVDPKRVRDAYGAEVTVRAGGRRWLRPVTAAGSYLCSNDPRAHFGLGASARVDAIEVLWPDGSREAFPGGPADRLVTLRQGEGRAVSRPAGG
jgi:hypothetical protein